MADEIKEVPEQRWVEVTEPATNGQSIVDIDTTERLKQARRIATAVKVFERMGEDIHAIRQQTRKEKKKHRWEYDEHEWFYKATIPLDNGISQKFTEDGVALLLWKMDGTGTVQFEDPNAPAFPLQDIILWPQRFTKFYITASAQAGKTLIFYILRDEKFWGQLAPMIKSNVAPLGTINQLPVTLTGAGNLKVAIQEQIAALTVQAVQSGSWSVAATLAQLPAALSGLGNLKVDIAEAISLAVTNVFLDVALSSRAAAAQLPSALTGAGSLKAAIVEALSQLPTALSGAGNLKVAIQEAISLAVTNANLDVALSTRAASAQLPTALSAGGSLKTMINEAIGQLPAALTSAGSLKIAILEALANRTTGFSKQYSVSTAAVTLDAQAVPAGFSVALWPDTANSGQIAYTIDGTVPAVATNAGLKANQGIRLFVDNVNRIKVIASAAGQLLNVTVEA